MLTTVQIATAQVPILLNEVVSTTDRFGNKVCFRIVAMCFNSVDSCGPRCVIDGNIYLADCMTKRVYDTLDYETYHVEYYNGGWRWGYYWDIRTHTCELCSCAYFSGPWAYSNHLSGLQDLVDLAQYLNSCCAPAVPNPIDCDSTDLDVFGFCIRFKRWCCNGRLKRLEFELYDCNNADNVIVSDKFSLNYHGGSKKEQSSYDIFSDPDNPCSLSEEQRRMILQVFLDSQGEDPCDDTREKYN